MGIPEPPRKALRYDPELDDPSKHSHYFLEFDFQEFLARAPPQRLGGSDRWGSETGSSFKVTGRHVLNAWRIMRSEQPLTSYTLSNVAFHVLQQRWFIHWHPDHKLTWFSRIPWYSTATLSRWYDSPAPIHMVMLLRYLMTCACTTLHILEATETIFKTAYGAKQLTSFDERFAHGNFREFARIFGVDFYSVISRGSQFKVESFMFRIAKPENFLLPSPSRNDVCTCTRLLNLQTEIFFR